MSIEQSQALVQAALDLGFDDAAVVPATPAPSAEYLEKWLNEGNAGEMTWLARNPAVRSNPREFWPEARSILVVALNYYQDDPDFHEANSDLRGIIAKYARGRDYHNIFPPRLKKLGRIASEIVGREVNFRTAVDTSPMLERPLAAAGHFGFIGKNTLLIHRKLGSWFFLGEVLLSIELPATYTKQPPRFGCGECTRCIDACPTGALDESYQCKANRCLSYLTIEHRGQISRELRAKMGKRIFGCDICQEVCPYNARKKEVSSEISLLAQSDEDAIPQLAELVRLNEEEFAERFRGRAVKRAKREGLVRNAVIALGNSADSDAVPVLTEAMSDPSFLVRGHAAWALGQHGDNTAKSALANALQIENDEWVKSEIEEALGESSHRQD